MSQLEFKNVEQKEIRSLIRRANECEDSNDLDHAIYYMQEACEIPTTETSHHICLIGLSRFLLNRGKQHLKNGSFEAAIIDFSEALLQLDTIQIRSEDIENFYEEVFNFLDKTELESSIKNPLIVRVLVARGKLAKTAGDYEFMNTLFALALSYPLPPTPANLSQLVELCKALATSPTLDDEERYYYAKHASQFLNELSPNDRHLEKAFFSEVRADIKMKLGNFSRARSLYELASTFAPENKDYYQSKIDACTSKIEHPGAVHPTGVLARRGSFAAHPSVSADDLTLSDPILTRQRSQSI